jgi:hypothetical protein
VTWCLPSGKLTEDNFLLAEKLIEWLSP